jgi:signal peptidase I
MRRHLRLFIELVSAVLGTALLAVVVLTLTGSVAWVVTTGSSMEPTFSDGDVAVVRPAGDYAVGDVVAYHNPDLGQIVMHRVIEEVDGRLVTQGDNNGWVDSHRPTSEEVVGSLSMHLPGLGRVLELLFQPAVAAALTFVGTILVLGRGTARRPSERPIATPQQAG